LTARQASALRFAWVVAMNVFLLAGGIGLPIAIDWLGTGDSSKPFTVPRWLQRRRQRG
jgi:hypothetical protein